MEKPRTKLDLIGLTIGIRVWGFFKIPMVCRMRPSLVAYDEKRVVFKIPLIRGNRNHLGSMYVGVLAGAADLTGGFLAIDAIRRSGVRVNMVIKAVSATFLKRTEGHAYFSCEQTAEVRALVDQAIATGERAEMPLRVTVTVPSKISEPTATFDLILSIKKKEARTASS